MKYLIIDLINNWVSDPGDYKECIEDYKQHYREDFIHEQSDQIFLCEFPTAIMVECHVTLKAPIKIIGEKNAVRK